MDVQSLVKSVDLYMQQHLPRYIEELRTLCAIDSYSFYKPGLDEKEPLVCTPASLKIVRKAQDIAGMLGFSINHVLTGGASDCSYISSYGIPTIDGLGPIGGLDHSPGEYIKMSSIAPRTALLAGLLVSIDTLY